MRRSIQSANVLRSAPASQKSSTVITIRPALVTDPDPFEHVRHCCRFPFASARRGNAAPVESGGDLPKRLGAGSSSLGDDRRDGGGERAGPGCSG